MAVAATRAGFWLQHASRENEELVSFADDLAQTAHGRPGIAFGPVNARSTVDPLFERARRAGDAVMDPHGFFIDRAHTARSRRHYPWLAQTPRPATQAQWEAWMQLALDHQLSTALRGSAPPPSFVMTASPVIEAARGALELYAVLDAAAAVRQRLPTGTDCWLSISVDRTYMREEQHLTTLANTMLAAQPSGVVFRASHSQLAPVDDRQFLFGVSEFVQAAAANGIRVFMPNSGWLGWLAMAWGAWGFSGGMAAGTWVDRVPGPMTRPERPSEPYFERQLLRTVPWRVHEQLVGDASYQACTCPDCTNMGNTHHLADAKRHQIRHAHAEGSALMDMGPADRRAHVGDRLDQAIAFRDDLPTQLRARVGGEFLDRWRLLV